MLLNGTQEGKRPLDSPRRSRVDNIKMCFRDLEWNDVAALVLLRIMMAQSTCEPGDELQASIRFWEVLESLYSSRLLSKGLAVQSVHTEVTVFAADSNLCCGSLQRKPQPVFIVTSTDMSHAVTNLAWRIVVEAGASVDIGSAANVSE
jgi:hypothetical protein